MAPKTKPK
jgi:hypothetical protein